MVELPCYVRVKKSVSEGYAVNRTVEEDEILRLISATEEGWYEGKRLSGEIVYVDSDNVGILELPDLRKDELYIVVSIAEYSSLHAEDISFGKNTVIIVGEEVDSNWSKGIVVGYNGKRLGRSGLFPKSFVLPLKVESELSIAKTNAAVLDYNELPKETSKFSDGVPEQVGAPLSTVEKVEEMRSETSNASAYDTPLEAAPEVCAQSSDLVLREHFSGAADTTKPHAKTIFPFRGESEGMLSFEPEAIIYLRRYLDDGWVEGELDGKVGLVPASYIRIIVDLPGKFSIGGKPLSRRSRNSALGIASVLYDFNGREEDELSVHAGESVSLLELVNTEWARCYDPGRDRTGIIPISFLNIFMNEEDEESSHEDSSDSESLPESHLNANPSFFATDGEMTMGSAGREDPVVQDVSSSSTPQNRGITFEAKSLESFFHMKPTSLLPSSEWLDDLKSRRRPPARPPPPKFKTVAKTAVALKKPPPPRPAELPKRLSLATAPSLSLDKVQPSFSFETYELVPRTNVFSERQESLGVGKVADNEASRRHVIDDLISSELQYLSDIGMWEAEISQSTGISSDYKRILTNGFPQLKELSRLLISQLVEQQGKPVDHQCFGEAFLSLRDNFMRTFGFYFRSVEAVSNIIAGRDQHLQQSLNECVVEMRSLGSNVFDVPTAVSRPVQRCLKYPLFIGELIKTTPLTHTDHPKLLEAVKQMSLLASKMNESKRRKELVVKYRNAAPEPLTKRLSRLNMHSVKKKGNRFKYRLTSQIGLVHIDKDPAFDNMAENLDHCERRICKLLHAVQVYKQLIVFQSKKYVETYTTTEKLSGNSNALNAEIRGYCKALLQESTWLAHYLDDAIGTEAKKFLRLPITKVIQKRYDKLLDYMSAKKEEKNLEEVHLRQCDYEALNNQLKATLPKIIENIKKRTFSFVETVVAKDMEFFDTFVRLREQLSPEAKQFLTVPFSTYIGSSERRLRSFLSIGKAISAEVSFARGVSLTESVFIKKHSHVEIGRIVAGFSPNTAADSSFRKSYPTPHSPPPRPPNKAPSGEKPVESKESNLIDFDDNLLDLVTPLRPQIIDSSKTSSAPLVEKSRDDLLSSTKTALTLAPSSPVSCVAPYTSKLSSVAGIPLPMSADVLLNDLLPDEMDRSQILSSLDPPLVPYRPYESSTALPAEIRKSFFTAPLYPVSEVLFSAQRESEKPVFPAEGAISDNKDCSYYDSPAGINNPPVYYEPPIVQNGSNLALQRTSESDTVLAPVRAAPLPPKSEEVLLQTQENLVFELWKASYAYECRKDCEVSLVLEEVVHVLRKHDDARNEDWWLVRKQSGEVGYVPAAYLTNL